MPGVRRRWAMTPCFHAKLRIDRHFLNLVLENSAAFYSIRRTHPCFPGLGRWDSGAFFPLDFFFKVEFSSRTEYIILISNFWPRSTPTNEFADYYFLHSSTRTRTRANTNPNGTEASAAGRSVRACVARESKREKGCGVGGRLMRLMDGRGVGSYCKLTHMLYLGSNFALNWTLRVECIYIYIYIYLFRGQV